MSSKNPDKQANHNNQAVWEFLQMFSIDHMHKEGRIDFYQKACSFVCLVVLAVFFEGKWASRLLGNRLHDVAGKRGREGGK